jgi:hypothetical protein
MKQGWGNDYIPVTLTSSNSGWHKGWFYLRNDPEFMLPEFTGNSITELQRNWSDGPGRRSRRKSSRIIGQCWGVSKEPESPWRR